MNIAIVSQAYTHIFSNRPGCCCNFHGIFSYSVQFIFIWMIIANKLGYPVLQHFPSLINLQPFFGKNISKNKLQVFNIIFTGMCTSVHGWHPAHIAYLSCTPFLHTRAHPGWRCYFLIYTGSRTYGKKSVSSVLLYLRFPSASWRIEMTLPTKKEICSAPHWNISCYILITIR